MCECHNNLCIQPKIQRKPKNVLVSGQILHWQTQPKDQWAQSSAMAPGDEDANPNTKAHSQWT